MSAHLSWAKMLKLQQTIEIQIWDVLEVAFPWDTRFQLAFSSLELAKLSIVKLAKFQVSNSFQIPVLFAYFCCRKQLKENKLNCLLFPYNQITNISLCSLGYYISLSFFSSKFEGLKILKHLISDWWVNASPTRLDRYPSVNPTIRFDDLSYVICLLT